jgi:hypothetical protein
MGLVRATEVTEKCFLSRIGHRLRGLWLGEEVPILDKPFGLRPNIIFPE